ncbi:hypothetical protein GIB67_029214 [Kingdonia uniflora]|uniref:Aminotransferase-like plant mobile domain-containing protein n=1 Tax=Kingdonia uniflora TaxID=39325 RepID=A0A7J7NAR7_9MAGN|nr:hypothetical protein GIB67_029214 [Kingdonia uniflora]
MRKCLQPLPIEKKELAREEDLLTYKRKRKTIDPNTIVPPNTVDTTNEGGSELVPLTESAQAALRTQAESAQAVNISQGLEFETESAKATLGAQPPLLNVSPDYDVHIPIVGGYSEGERDTSNEDVGPSDKSLLRIQEKLPIHVHHYQSVWDLTKEPQVVQDFVKLKSLDRIRAISYNYYNSVLISAFAKLWQPETNSFHFKWGEMTPTLDDEEQLVGLPVNGDATVIGGTWGFPAILKVFENNLVQDLNAFKSLKAGGAGNLLSLRKLKEYYSYKLEKVLSDGTTIAVKKKGLTTRFVARAYMLYVLGSFLFPMKKGTDVSAWYLYLFVKEKVTKKWSWGSTVLAHMYYNLGIVSRDDGRQFAYCTMLLESWIFAYFPKLAEIPKVMDSDAYEHCTCWKWDVFVTDRYGGTTLLKFREALDNYKLEDTSECDLLKETIEQMKEDNQLKRVVDEQYALEFADLPKQLDAKILECKNLEAELRQKSGLEYCNQSLSVELNKKCKESESLKVVNALLMEQIDLHLPSATLLAVLQSHQPVSDATLAKKYDDLLAAHEDVKKKLIAKEDFCKKLVNVEERMKSLEVNNSEWEV